MHAGMAICQFELGKIGEAISVWRESLLPAAKKQQGFKGGLLLTDTNRDKGIGTGLWETETRVGSSPHGKWGRKGWRGL